jgi:hypothetical protein
MPPNSSPVCPDKLSSTPDIYCGQASMAELCTVGKQTREKQAGFGTV